MKVLGRTVIKTIIKTKRPQISATNWNRKIFHKLVCYLKVMNRKVTCCECGAEVNYKHHLVSRGASGRKQKKYYLPSGHVDCKVPVGCPVSLEKDVNLYCRSCWEKHQNMKNEGYTLLKKHEGKDIYYSHDVVQGGLPSLGKR